MSTISLCKNEAIVIRNEIIVTVLGICGDEVQLGIERPWDVSPATDASIGEEEVCAAVAPAADAPAGSW
jgi:sRNA-binding carbon storage regulator CsrA